eukprot:COSAG01_NODE_3581_length_5911_cov_688.858052_5_plen_203_part_00
MCFGLGTVFPPRRIGWSRAELFCAILDFFDVQRESRRDGGWSREGKIRFPRQPGVQEDHSIDRTGRFQGMLQLARKRVCGRRGGAVGPWSSVAPAAEAVLVALENAIERTAQQLRRIKPAGGDPRAEANAVLKAFEKALSKMSIGLSALQIASLAVNLDVMGKFAGLSPLVRDELLCGAWPGAGKGTKKSLSYVGLGKHPQP